MAVLAILIFLLHICLSSFYSFSTSILPSLFCFFVDSFLKFWRIHVNVWVCASEARGIRGPGAPSACESLGISVGTLACILQPQHLCLLFNPSVFLSLSPSHSVRWSSHSSWQATPNSEPCPQVTDNFLILSLVVLALRWMRCVWLHSCTGFY